MSANRQKWRKTEGFLQAGTRLVGLLSPFYSTLGCRFLLSNNVRKRQQIRKEEELLYNRGMSVIKVHFMNVWKYHNETPLYN
jgi:hypothetical protein